MEGVHMIRVMLMLGMLLMIGCEKEIREAKAPVDLNQAALAQAQDR